MAKIHMKEVADILGVELYEEFDIDTPMNECALTGYFSKIGFSVKSKNGTELVHNAFMMVLYQLLVGAYTIRRRNYIA